MTNTNPIQIAGVFLKGSMSNMFIKNSCLGFLCPSSTISSWFLENLSQFYVLIGGDKDGILPLGIVYFWRTHEALLWSESSRLWHKPSWGIKYLKSWSLSSQNFMFKNKYRWSFWPLNYSLNIYLTTNILIIIFLSMDSVISINTIIFSTFSYKWLFLKQPFSSLL